MIKKILVVTDFSKLSLTALRPALDLAKKYSASIDLLHVIERSIPMLIIRTTSMSEEKISEAMYDDAVQSLKKITQELSSEDRKLITTAVRRGNDYEEIISYADDESIDIIVIASHGRTGILHTLMGSVAEKVIRYSRCMVLVITPSEADK